MFGPLHALAQNATLLIVVSAEDVDQLRVNVTPTKAGSGGKEHPLRPLSLVGTPAELDEGFTAALAEWQAPRRSLIEQARDAAGDSDEPKAKAAAPKALPAPVPAPAAKKVKDKPAAAKAAAKTGDKDGSATVALPTEAATTGTTQWPFPTGATPSAVAATPAPGATTTSTLPANKGTSSPEGEAVGTPAAEVATTSTTAASADEPAPPAEDPAADVFTLDLF